MTDKTFQTQSVRYALKCDITGKFDWMVLARRVYSSKLLSVATTTMYDDPLCAWTFLTYKVIVSCFFSNGQAVIFSFRSLRLLRILVRFSNQTPSLRFMCRKKMKTFRVAIIVYIFVFFNIIHRNRRFEHKNYTVSRRMLPINVDCTVYELFL